jgi:predicted nucleic acid-binding Zn ribbon protein
MPLYLYDVFDEQGRVVDQFEIMQKLAEPALEQHPETGAPVRRALVAPGLMLKHPSVHSRDLTSDKYLASKGFARYEKTGDGKYQRTGGDAGPKTFDR